MMVLIWYCTLFCLDINYDFLDSVLSSILVFLAFQIIVGLLVFLCDYVW